MTMYTFFLGITSTPALLVGWMPARWPYVATHILRRVEGVILMMKIKSKVLARTGVVLLAVAVLAALFAGSALAVGGVVILTSPIDTDFDLYIDANSNGVYDASEFVGTFDVYAGNGRKFLFSWDAYNFPAGANGAYRVALWQNTTPLAATPTWVERKVAFHLANNPNPTEFSVGAFGFGETICETCPTKVVVQAHTYTTTYDPATGKTTYNFTPVGSAAIAAALTSQGTQQSEEFLLKVFGPEPCQPVLTCECTDFLVETCVNSCSGEVTQRSNLTCFIEDGFEGPL